LLNGLALLSVLAPCNGQSNRSIQLTSDGIWHLHSHIPLGIDALLLEPSHRVVQMMASAEAPAFAGWTLRTMNNQPVLLDSSGKPVHALPHSVTFRITASARERLANSVPMPLDCAKSVDDFLLDLRFTVQIFRGMQMREVNPIRQWMIGVPADESFDERIYRASFELGDIRPDDRIVLLVTDGSGTRLTKFHLEFL
jgi:hypothetical protein